MQQSGSKKRVAGTISADNQSILLRFRRSQKRDMALHSLEGVYFDPTVKHWRIPFYEFERMLGLSEFSPAVIRYELDRDKYQEQARHARSLYVSAWQAIRANPFSVSEQQISAGNVPAVVSLHRSGVTVCLRFQKVLKNRKKKKEVLLKQFHDLLVCNQEKAVIVPVLTLPSVLRWCRDEGISFAVSEACGKQLAESAIIRKSLLEKSVFPAATDLRKAFLYPLIEMVDGKFILHAATRQWLQKLLPHRKPGNSLRVTLNIAEVVSAIEAHIRMRLSLWIDHDTKLALFEHLKGNASVNIFLLPLLFEDKVILDATVERGILLYGKDLSCFSGSCFPSALDGAAKLLGILQAEVPDSLPPGIADAVAENQPFCTAAFLDYRDRLHARQQLSNEREYFQSLIDCELNLSNSQLEQVLFPHQRVAVSWIMKRKASILGDDMGLGKTLSVLAAWEELLDREECSFLLVLCPNSLVHNWQREASHWIKGKQVHILPDSKRDRILALDALLAGRLPAQALVIHYEAARLKYITPMLEELCKNQKVMLCCDESQRVKNPSSHTYRAVSAIAKQCNRRVLLSGTPAPRAINDLWSQVYLVDRGERFGSSYYEWLSSIAEMGTRWSPFAIKRFIPEKVKQVTVATREIMLRRKKEDVIALPEKIFSVRDVPLTGSQLERYEEVRKQLLLRITTLSGKEFQRSIDNVLEQYLRAVQLASNPRLVDPGWKGEPAKFMELDTIVNELVEEQGEKLVVWTNYRHNVEELTGRYSKHGAEAFTGDTERARRAEIVSEFQKPNQPPYILVAIPSAGGTGITLTAAQTAVYLDKTWNAEHWMQSIDRIHRIGQTGTVSIISFHSSGVDTLISRNLNKKMELQREIFGEGEVPGGSFLPEREALLQAVSSLKWSI